MKSVFKRQWIVIFIALAVLSACKGSQAESNSIQDKQTLSQSDSICGSTEKVLFQFNDRHLTKFLIPEAYLDNPYNLYHKTTDPVDFISIRTHKSDLSPKCDKTMGTLDTDFHIKIDKGNFENLKNTHKNTLFPALIKQEGSFYLYRLKPVEDLRGIRDLLIPIKQEENIFIVCLRPGLSGKDDRAGCTVYAKISDTIYMEQSLNHADLENYSAINRNIQKLLMSFLVSPQNQDN